MNLKRIIIAMTVVLIGTGNINAQDMKTEVPKISDFPVGEENTGYAQYFTGKSWLTSKDSKNQTNRLFHFCTLLLQTDSINQHLTKEKCTKNKAV